MSVRLSKNGKRLGRPPKDATKVSTFTITKKVEKPVFQVQNEEMLECSFVSIPEYSHSTSEDRKCGRYAQSTYSLNNFGKSSYVVLAYIETDLEKHRNDQISDEQIVARCVNYLNQEEKKRKGSSKPYGNLQLYGFRIIKKFGKEVIAIELVTDSRTNTNFWGTGHR